MNKRVLDGKGIWRSDKIARIEPAWVKSEYANLLPLATATGSFEFCPRKVWSDCYSFNRPEISREQVRDVILPSIHSVGLLFTWEQDNKIWAFFTGIDKPGSGRLPPPSRIRKGHEIVGPEPPTKQVQEYLEAVRRNGGRVDSHWLANGCLGFGSGLGLGKGLGITSSEVGTSDKAKKPITQSGQEARLEAVRPLAELLAQRILENNPKSELRDEKLRGRRTKAWIIDLEKMVRLDGWTNEEIRQLVEFSQCDQFWRTNILSAGKLREKRDQLKLKMEQQKKGAMSRAEQRTANNLRNLGLAQN